MSENKYLFDLRECTIINNFTYENMLREKIENSNEIQMLRNRIYNALNYLNELDEYLVKEEYFSKITEILTGDSNDSNK